MNKKPFIVGITGGIGAGKSQVSIILSELGAYIIDADRVSRELTDFGKKGYLKLREHFPQFFDEKGSLLRRELREHVFSKNLTDKLNEIMMPLIISEIETLILLSKERLIFCVAPLLFESGLNTLCDTVICVTSSKDVRIERVMARDNISKGLVERMMDSQLLDIKRLEGSDIVIINDGSIDDLRCKVIFYYEKIKKSIEENN